MSQAPPPLAPTGEDAIYQTIDVEPEAFADDEEAGSLSEAYEVELTLQEIEKGGYQRVSTPLQHLFAADWSCRTVVWSSIRADQIKLDRSVSNSQMSSCTMPSPSSEL